MRLTFLAVSETVCVYVGGAKLHCCDSAVDDLTFDDKLVHNGIMHDV